MPTALTSPPPREAAIFAPDGDLVRDSGTGLGRLLGRIRALDP